MVTWYKLVYTKDYKIAIEYKTLILIASVMLTIVQGANFKLLLTHEKLDTLGISV